jgi:hypothetical protein
VPTLSSPSRQPATALERVIIATSRKLGVDLEKIGAAIGVGGEQNGTVEEEE